MVAPEAKTENEVALEAHIKVVEGLIEVIKAKLKDKENSPYISIADLPELKQAEDRLLQLLAAVRNEK